MNNTNIARRGQCATAKKSKLRIIPIRTTLTPHAEHINRLRRLLKPSPVRLRSIPIWLRFKLLKAFSRESYSNSSHALLMTAAKKCGDHFDFFICNSHFGATTLADGRHALCFEPYYLCAIDQASIAKFCELLEAHYLVIAPSWHNPESTCRVVVCDGPLFGFPQHR
jgi:hypothetical protein